MCKAGHEARWAILASLFFAALLCACGSPHAGRANFERCLASDRGCDTALLSAGERQRIWDVENEKHFQDCLAGLRCNERALSGDERHQVRAAAAKRNLSACLGGEADCRRDALAEDERAKVRKADAERNFRYCLGGLTACDAAALTDSQRSAVRAAYLERNYSGCMNAVGTLVNCNPADLSSEQRERVRLRNLEANAYICANALMGCDEALLTPEQRDQIRR